MGFTDEFLIISVDQAVNCAGAGPFSATASCVTPPSNPGVVTSVRASSTATSIHVSWREPNDNGSKINGYYISVDDRSILAVDNVLDYVIDDLQPETIYRSVVVLLCCLYSVRRRLASRTCGKRNLYTVVFVKLFCEFFSADILVKQWWHCHPRLSRIWHKIYHMLDLCN